MNRKNLTKAQHAVLLDEIARNALQAADLARKTQDAALNEHSTGSLLTAIELMVLRIGWIAEKAAEGLGIDSNCGADVDFWLLPDDFSANTTGNEAAP